MWTLINLVNLCLWILVRFSFNNLTRGVPGFCLVFIFSSLSCSAFSCILSLASELPHNNDEGDGILQRSRLNWISSQFHLQISVWMCSTRRSRFYWLIYMSIFWPWKGFLSYGVFQLQLLDNHLNLVYFLEKWQTLGWWLKY